MKYILILLASVILVSGCISTTTQTQNTTSVSDIRVVSEGDKIAVDYTGTFENGTVFDSSVGKQPLEFTAGAGQMIKGFDAAVIGMHLDEEKTVTIPPEDAYGAYDPAKILEVPVANIPGTAKVGDTLYAGSVSVRVLAINSTTAVMDMNHHLAGKTLVFRIKLLNVTKGS